MAVGDLAFYYTLYLCSESILVSAMIAAIIGHSEVFITQLSHERLSDELGSDQCFWQSTSPNFRGTRSDFPSKV